MPSPLERRSSSRRLLLSLAGLLLLYLVVIALGDVRAWSGSDAGGKVATVLYMAHHHTWVPEVGYWAARQDPTAAYHPLIKTVVDNGHFVQATTLPFVYLGVLLWQLGGDAALLALPVLGSLLAAYAARRLALGLGAENGWWAFWLIGAASPMLFYAGDFWEHSAAVGLALLAFALVLEPPSLAKALCAGLLAGAAVTLRADVMADLGAAAAAFLLVRELRRRWLGRPGHLAVFALGAMVPLAAARVAARLLLGAAAGGVGGREAGALGQAGSGGLAERVRQTVLTTFGLFPDIGPRYLALGLIAAVALVVLAWPDHMHLPSSDRPLSLPRAASLVAGVAYGARTVLGGLGFLLGGLGFVPGAFAAAPVATAGLTRARTSAARALVVTAVLSVLMVSVFSWQGDLIAQWGGRYLLVPAALLTVVGAVAIELEPHLDYRLLLPAALAIGMSALGAGWHIQRTRGVAAAMTTVEAVPKDFVVVSQVPHLGREAGAFYEQHRWLTARTQADLSSAASILKANHVSRLEVVGVDGLSVPPIVDGFRSTTVRFVPFLGVRLRVTQFTSTG